MNSISHTLKIVITGDSVVGKTTLLRRYTHNIYDETISNTVGVDFAIKLIKREDKKIKLQIWDTAGQERFKSIIASYYRSADIVLICYDITNRKSLDSLKYWITKVDNLVGEKTAVAIVGTKLDLDKKREVSHDEVDQMANDLDLMFVELSSKVYSSDRIAEILVNPLIDKVLGHVNESLSESSDDIIRIEKREELESGRCCLN